MKRPCGQSCVVLTTNFKGHILGHWSRLWSKALRGQLIWFQLNACSQRANVGAGAAQRRQLEHSSCRATTRPPSPQLSPLNMGVFPSSWCNTATDRRARTPIVRWTDGDLRANAGVFLGDDHTTETHSREVDTPANVRPVEALARINSQGAWLLWWYPMHCTVGDEQ